MLIENGADASARDSDGKTGLDYAESASQSVGERLQESYTDNDERQATCFLVQKAIDLLTLDMYKKMYNKVTHLPRACSGQRDSGHLQLGGQVVGRG
jgi:ankyrin repeat protein